jgi:long-subunit fatty acid transport protein
LVLSGASGNLAVAGGNGTTTAGFLKIGVGARAIGMGGAFASVADDASAVYWNPAGLGRLEDNSAQFSHYDWLQDIKVENFYAAFPLQSVALGIGITYVDFGTLQSYDESGNPGEELSLYNMAAVFSIAGMISEDISLGASVKYIEQSFDLVKGQGIAGDIGLIAKWDGVDIGLAILNMGAGLKFETVEENLPTEFRGGISFRQFNRRVLFSLEGHAPLRGEMSVHQGVEYQLANQLFARSGLVYQTNSQADQSALKYNLGFGVGYGSGQFDYTFSPSDSFGADSRHNLSFSIMW